jgi:hypothetical protein
MRLIPFGLPKYAARCARKGVSVTIFWHNTDPVGFLRYFFSPACQLSTTVMGLGDGSPLCAFTRKRLPSREGT